MDIQDNGASQNVFSSVKVVVPGAVADDRDQAGSIQAALFFSKRPTLRESNAERVEVVRRHQAAAHAVALLFESQREAFEPAGRESAQCLGLGGIVQIIP